MKHLCETCVRFKAGVCSVRAPAAEKLAKGETVHSCSSFVGSDGKRDLHESSPPGVRRDGP